MPILEGMEQAKPKATLKLWQKILLFIGAGVIISHALFWALIGPN